MNDERQQQEEYERAAQMKADVLAGEMRAAAAIEHQQHAKILAFSETLRRARTPGEDDGDSDVGDEPAPEPEPSGYTERAVAANARFLPKRFVWQDAADLCSEPDTQPLWLVEGLLPEAGVCVIAGEPKSTKTWAAIELAVALATATPAFGEFEVKTKRKVGLFLVEDSKRSVRTRLRVMAESRGASPEDLRGNVLTICRGSLNLSTHTDAAELVESVRGLGLALLVLDPLRDLHHGDENDSTEMARVMTELRWIRDELGCSVLFVHHSGKASKDTAGRRPGQRMRGSSAVHGAVDAGIYLSDTKTDLQSYWTNRVSVEIKEGAGAGLIDLTLNLRNVRGVAQSGSWDIERVEGEARASQAQEEASAALRQAILGVLSGGAKVSVNRLAKDVRHSHRVVTQTLELMRSEGLVVEAVAGYHNRGWTLNPANPANPAGIGTASTGQDVVIPIGTIPPAPYRGRDSRAGSTTGAVPTPKNGSNDENESRSQSKLSFADRERLRALASEPCVEDPKAAEIRREVLAAAGESEEDEP